MIRAKNEMTLQRLAERKGVEIFLSSKTPSWYVVGVSKSNRIEPLEEGDFSTVARFVLSLPN